LADSLLRSLRDRLMDESEPLAGLLRKCLLLGAETGSDSLRQWARSELNGYDQGAELPAYRRLPSPAISVSSISGNLRVTGQIFSRLQLPAEAQAVVPEELPLHQPIEELELLAEQGTLSFTGPGLAYAQTIWNEQLDWGQQITGMSFSLSGSAIAGVLGQVRTQLVDVVAELTAGTPLAELPGKDKVDAAVQQHIGAQYNTTIHAPSGPTSIGTKSKAIVEGLNIKDAITLLDTVRAASNKLDDEQAKTDLLEALEELRAEVESPTPDTGAVVKKAGKLRAVAARIGAPALSAVVGGAVEALTSLAIGGAFG
jgi:AbiTii